VEHHVRWEPCPRRINKESVSMVIFVCFAKRPLLSPMERNKVRAQVAVAALKKSFHPA
jgi:hypothetical protein